MNEYYVYMMASSNNNALYIGLTNDIRRRYEEHCSGNVPGFSQKYKVHKLVYLEQYTEVNDAIAREKQLKGWSRANGLMQGEVEIPRLRFATLGMTLIMFCYARNDTYYVSQRLE